MRLGRQTAIFEIFIVLLLVFPLLNEAAGADATVKSETLTLTAFQDGFVQVNHNLELIQPNLSIAMTLLGETRQNLIVVDENSIPLDYEATGNNTVIYNVGSTGISISYLTQDLTSKTGRYWNLRCDYPKSKIIVLPQDASIISLNTVPDMIDNSNGQLTLTMPLGLTEITYTAEHTSNGQKEVNQTNSFDFWRLETWQLIVILSLPPTATLTIVGFWVLRLRNKKAKVKPKTETERLDEVDLNKLLSRHRELRQDELQVINYLASKHGKAFEAELFALLNLPRTTTWRLIKRLERMEIVYVKKSRRQNIVLIREKYLKKSSKPTSQS